MANTKSLSLTASSSQYLAVADASVTGLEPTTDLTIRLWFKTSADPSSNGRYTICGKYDDNAKRSWILYLSEQGNGAVYPQFIVSDDGSYTNDHRFDWRDESHDIQPNTWYHLVVSFDIDAETCVFYVSNNKNASPTVVQGTSMGTALYNNDAPLIVGARYNNGTLDRYYDGLIDELALFSSAWGDSDVSTDYNSGYGDELAGSETNLISGWRFEDNYLDLTSNNNDFTAYNSPTFSTDVPFSGGSSASASESRSPSLSPSASQSPSSSPSSSESRSPSLSPSASESRSPSASISPSPSASESRSPSASVSLSPSASPSSSQSPSSSASLSPSSSISLSPSASESRSPSASISLSPSASQSPSSSVSSSPSPSPSQGYQAFTRGSYAALPTDTADLETDYSAQDETDVATKNDVRVLQAATGEYAIHQYKNFVGNASTANLEWEGQTNVAPSTSTVYLQIYNHNTSEWETVDSDNSSAVDTDFSLTAVIASLTNYRDASLIMSCRVYQYAV
jgi:hypothetical protein